MSGSGLTTIAHCFRQIDAALAISALEAAGYDVFAPHFQISGLTPHCAIAYGGIPLRVPAAQAAEATTFLQDLHDTASAAETPSKSGYRRGWVYTVRDVVLFFLGGSRPPAGLFLCPASPATPNTQAQ